MLRGAWTSLLLISLSSIACTPYVGVYLTRQDEEKYQSLTIEGLRQQGRTLMAEADKKQLPEWAPLHYAQAQMFWNQVESARGDDRQAMLRQVASIDKLLQDALVVQPSVYTVLREPLTIAHELSGMTLPHALRNELATLRKTLRGLTERAEAGQGDWLGPEPERINALLKDLLRRAQREAVLGEISEGLARMREQDAERYIPRTLQGLGEALRDADQYIARYPRHKDAIAQVRKELQRQLHRAQGMLEYVRDNELRARMAFETIAIDEDARLTSIAAAMGVEIAGGGPAQSAVTLAAVAARLAADDTAAGRARDAQELLALQSVVEQLRKENAALQQQTKSTAVKPPEALPPPINVNTKKTATAARDTALPPPLSPAQP